MLRTTASHDDSPYSGLVVVVKIPFVVAGIGASHNQQSPIVGNNTQQGIAAKTAISTAENGDFSNLWQIYPLVN